MSRGTWDYVQSDRIASEYDAYFVDSPLMRLDLELLESRLPPMAGPLSPPLIADLGCGTGRVARRLLPRGYRMLNIDLSTAMLREVEAHIAPEYRARSTCLHANLVELDSVLQADSIDFAACLFSSLGMIRGRENRRRFLRGTHRALRPEGELLLHVHNRYHRIWDPGTPRWLCSSWLQSRRHADRDFGDRTYAYRGLPAMYLHIYSCRELVSDLRSAGFKELEILPLSSAADRLLGDRWWTRFSAGGFFALASK